MPQTDNPLLGAANAKIAVSRGWIDHEKGPVPSQLADSATHNREMPW